MVRNLQGILRRKYHLEVEMTTENYVLALAAVGDTREGFRRLCKAIEEIDRQEAETGREEQEYNRENSCWKFRLCTGSGKAEVC